MSKNIRLVVYVTNPASTRPLPAHYLNLPDAKVLPASQSGFTCERDGGGWESHTWVVTSGQDFTAIDCSNTPREVPA